jgi:hypothetical protein
MAETAERTRPKRKAAKIIEQVRSFLKTVKILTISFWKNKSYRVINDQFPIIDIDYNRIFMP